MALDDRTGIGALLLVLCGFVLGAGVVVAAGYGSPWGTVGEWVSGVGAFVAAMVALHLGRSAHAREAIRERDRALVAAVRCAAVLRSSAIAVGHTRSATRDQTPEQRVREFRVFAYGFELEAGLNQLEDLRIEAIHLPARFAVDLETVLGHARILAPNVKLLTDLGARDPSVSAASLLEATLQACDVFHDDSHALADRCAEFGKAFSPRLARV